MSLPIDDEENPPLSNAKFFGLFKNPDPGFTQTAISMATNFMIANMVLYGLTGRGKTSYLLSMLTIPASVAASVRDSQKDYEQWKNMRILKAKGVPERFMPYQCKFDWTDYHNGQLKKEQNQ